MAEQVSVRVMATGSTDAAGKAKQTARALGYRVQTVASVRLAVDVPPPADPSRELGSWVVTLAVRSRS